MPSPPILLTGAAGFIGSHVAAALLARGERVVGIDNFDPFYEPALKRANADAVQSAARTSPHGPPAFTLVEADITDAGAMRRVFDQHRPAGVIHLAAKAGVRPSIADPVGYMLANVVGTSVLLEEARRLHSGARGGGGGGAGAGRFVLASSSSVYGNSPTSPFSEEQDVSSPISPYAASKKACELLGHAHWHLTGMPTACLRFFTVFGPRQRPDLAISLFIRQIARGEPIKMFGDGSTSRDYTYIDDIVAGVIASYDRIPEYGYRVWNLGGNSPIALHDMIATIARVVGREPRIDRAPAQPGDVERTYADLTRSRRELAYAPKTPFEHGVAAQWAAARSGLPA